MFLARPEIREGRKRSEPCFITGILSDWQKHPMASKNALSAPAGDNRGNSVLDLA